MRPAAARRPATLAALLIASLAAIACGAEDGDDDTSSSGSDTTCSTAACTTTSASTTNAGESSSDDTTTTLPGESSTMPAESSSTGTDPCATDVCSTCFTCTYDDVCADAHSQCSIDPGCSVALICVRDCLEQSRDPAACVAACDCPDGGPLTTLLMCATDVCVPNESCPALSC